MLGIEEPRRILTCSLDSHAEMPNAGLTNCVERQSSVALRLGGRDKIREDGVGLHPEFGSQGLESGTILTPERLIRSQLSCRSDRSRFQVRSLRDQIHRNPLLVIYTVFVPMVQAACDCHADRSKRRAVGIARRATVQQLQPRSSHIDTEL